MYIDRFMRIFSVEDCVKLYLETSESNYFGRVMAVSQNIILRK